MSTSVAGVLDRVLARADAGVRGAVELEVELATHATHALRVGRQEVLVECVAGSVWITCEGDPEDHVLAAGERVRTARRGRLVTLALEAARLHITTRAA
jgi:hypothetical protein